MPPDAMDMQCDPTDQKLQDEEEVINSKQLNEYFDVNDPKNNYFDVNDPRNND